MAADEQKNIRIGFLVGKTNPVDRSPPDYQPAGLPEKYHVQGAECAPWSREDDKDTWEAKFCIDACVGYKIKEEYGDEFEVDWIRLDEISIDRLSKNDVNFLVGIDLVTAWAVAHPVPGWDVLGPVKISAEDYPKIKEALSVPQSKVLPELELQDWVYRKDVYLAECQQAGVPILDTIYIDAAEPDSHQLIKEVTSRGWKKFVVKPFPSSWSVGFVVFETSAVVADVNLMINHFAVYKDRYERYLLQEFIEAPDAAGEPFYEIRMYWVNGEYMAAVSTHFGVASQDPEEWTKNAPGKDMTLLYRCPKGPLLERAKEIGQRAFEVASRHSTFQGKPTKISLIRVDVGVTAMQATGLEYKDGVCMFLNEFESLQADWHTRIFLGDPSCVGGNKFVGFEGFSMLDRMTEFFVKKARQLVRDGKEFELSFLPARKCDGARSRSRTPRRNGAGAGEEQTRR